MAGKLCVDCADCKPANPHQNPTSNQFRCWSPLAVGVHHEPMGEAPRPFGPNTDNAPSCNEMRNESLVFQTCGPDAKWYRTADDKTKQDDARHLKSVAALAKKEDADRKTAAKQASAESAA